MKVSAWVLCLFAVAHVFLATTASAQSQAFAAPRVGLGVALSDPGEALVTAGTGSGQTSGLMSGVLVPILVSPHFRLEPEFGIYRNSSTDSNGPSDQTTTSVRIGVGGFGILPLQRFTFSYGARAGYLRSITTTSNPAGTARIDAPGFYIAPAAGGEYLLSDYLGLGAEVQLKYSSWKWTDSGSSRKETSLATVGVLVLRFYFP